MYSLVRNSVQSFVSRMAVCVQVEPFTWLEYERDFQSVTRRYPRLVVAPEFTKVNILRAFSRVQNLLRVFSFWEPSLHVGFGSLCNIYRALKKVSKVSFSLFKVVTDITSRLYLKSEIRGRCADAIANVRVWERSQGWMFTASSSAPLS